MEKIANPSFYRNILNLMAISQEINLKTHNKKNYLYTTNGLILIAVKLPDIKGNYDMTLNRKTLSEIFKNVKDNDVILIDLKTDKTEITINSYNAKIKYDLKNYEKNEQNDKTYDHITKIKPINNIEIETEWLSDQINRLVFKEKDKSQSPFTIELMKDLIKIEDCNELFGKSEVSLLDYQNFKIEHKENAKIKLNYRTLKDTIQHLKNTTDKIKLHIQNNIPIKIEAEINDYIIQIFCSPMVDIN